VCISTKKEQVNKTMKFTVFPITLLLTISYFTVHSVPISYMVDGQQSVKMTRMKVNSSSAAKNINDKFYIPKLLNVLLPSYLNDLYINFSLNDGSQYITEINTIRSYRNQAKSKLNVQSMFTYTRG